MTKWENWIQWLNDKDRKFDPENGYKIVTWAFCGICGKKLNMGHKNEVMLGYHKECRTDKVADGGYHIPKCDGVIEIKADANSNQLVITWMEENEQN